MIKMIFIDKFKNRKKILFLIISISILVSSYFLVDSNIRLSLGLPPGRKLGLFLAFLTFLFLLFISWIEEQLTKQKWLIVFAKKELLLSLTTLFLFFIACLKSYGLLPFPLPTFFSLTLIALFLTLSLSFLNSWFKKIDLRIKKISVFILVLLILGFIVIYTKLCFLRFDAGLAGLYDLGNMEQAVWNTLHGNFLRSTTGEFSSRLGGHTDIFLAFLTPFYALWPSPKMLIFTQTLIVGLGAWPLFLITRRLLKSSLAGLIFVFAYLASPILGAACLFDFHAIVLVTSFLFFAFYFLINRRYFPYFIFILLALVCKEEVSLLIFLLGIYVYFKHNKKLGIATSLIGLSWFILAFFIIMPHFRNGINNIFLSRYSYLGSTKEEIIKTLITRPDIALRNLWNIKKLTYFFYLILPLGGLMLFSSFTLLGISSFAIYILASHEQMFSGGFHYSAPLLFYLIMGSIFGIKFCLKRLKARGYKLILLYSFVLFIFLNSLLFGFVFRFKLYGIQASRFDIQFALSRRGGRISEIKEIEKMIPLDASLSASRIIGVYFADRKDIYVFPKIDDAKFVVLEQPGRAWTEITYEDYTRAMDKFRKNKNYQIVYENCNYLVAKKKLDFY